MRVPFRFTYNGTLHRGNVPNGWVATGTVAQDTARGHVHTGTSSVRLYNGATLSQTAPVNGGCFYELSFFGHGEDALAGVTATVTFLSVDQTETGLQITVIPGAPPNSNGEFGYFRSIITAAPIDAAAANITFLAASTGG